MWRIGRAPNNASEWKMGFNLVFKGLKVKVSYTSSPPSYGMSLFLSVKKLRTGDADLRF